MKKEKYKEIVVPSESRLFLNKSIKKNYPELRKKLRTNPKVQFNKALAIKRLNLIKKLLQNKKGKVLDIGCGAGYLTAFLNKNKIQSYGVEPDNNSFLAGQKLLKKNKINPGRIIKKSGENFSFNTKFDLIVSFQVIEHVRNPKKVFQQSYKYLKKNGKLYFIIPNYHSFWEGHYEIFWIPWLNKKTAKIYLKLLGKKSDLVNELQFITPAKIRKIVHVSGFQLLGMGKEKFKQRMDRAHFNIYNSNNRLSVFLPILKIFKKLRLNSFICWLCLKLDFYYPIIVYASK